MRGCTQMSGVAALEFQKTTFDFQHLRGTRRGQRTAVAAQPVVAHDAVAGSQNADGIASVGGADRAGTASDLRGNLRIRAGLPVGNFYQRIPDFATVGTNRIRTSQGHIKCLAPTGEIFAQLRCSLAGQIVGLLRAACAKIPSEEYGFQAIWAGMDFDRQTPKGCREAPRRQEQTPGLNREVFL